MMQNGDGSTYLPFFKLMTCAFWVAWITVVFSGDCIAYPVVSSYETTFSFLLFATLGMGATMVAAAAIPDKTWKLTTTARSMYVTGLVCMVSTICIGFEALIPTPGFYMASVLAGSAFGIYTLRCSLLFVNTETRNASIAICLSALGGVLIYTLFSAMSQFYSNLVILLISSVFPLAGTFLDFHDRENPETYLLYDEASERLSPSFWRVVAFICLIVFPLSLVRGFYPRLLDPTLFDQSRLNAAMTLIALVTLIAIVETMRRNGNDFGRLFYSLFIVSAAIAVPVILLGTVSSVSGSLATVSKGVLLLASWSLLNLWSYKTGATPIRVFGFGYGMLMIASFFGYLFGGLSGNVLSESSAVLFESVTLMVCVIAAVVNLRMSDLSSIITPTPEMVESIEQVGDANKAAENEPEETLEVPETPADDECGTSIRPDSEAGEARKDDERKVGRFMLSCRIIAAEHDLTPRETDVFILLAKHMEVKTIADELFVSFNTARTHVRHIYAKLDIHNRRELDELVDSYKTSH